MHRPVRLIAVSSALAVAVATLFHGSCVDQSGRATSRATSESCMLCHNGSQHDDYAGPGLENPHPFPGDAEVLRCTQCHGGNPNGTDMLSSHVPPPPEIGDREFQDNDAHAWFNKLTLAGIDKVQDYTVNGVTYTGIDYLQFLNPGDLRVSSRQRGCGECHEGEATAMSRSPLGTEMGIFSGAFYAVGLDNAIPAHQGLFNDNAADYGWRAVTDPTHVHDPNVEGKIGQLIEPPVWSSRSTQGPEYLFRNQQFSAANLTNDVNADGSLITGSRLAKMYQEQVAFTCGDCHLGSSGANNRYGDFRPSGCSACHMPYSQDGRSRSQDPNVPKNEPLNPDAIDDPERAHVRSHRIRGVARTLANGTTVTGIDDHTCAGCHQGSNRMVMQFWGIRLDQNQDVVRGFQYPANPVSFQTTRFDTRLFDPQVDNNTFNGRNHNQYLLREDYDGDGRDDTPEDVHYEAGMGCVDCHGSADIHNTLTPNSGDIVSRMGHAIKVRCEDCHGTATAYAATTNGTNYSGQTATLAVDSAGFPLRHVERDSAGDYWLTSKLDGRRHYIRQVRDVIVDSGKTHPTTGAAIYTSMGSYAMGRDDNDPATGIGPQQTGSPHAGFSHLDSMNCASCHSAWSNSCIGCHLEGEYNEGNNFSNITGERIVFRQRFAEFVYQSPVPFSLGIGMDNMIRTSATNTKVFFRYRDLNGDRTPVFAFTDRNGGGNNTATTNYPSLGHNAFLAHSIRGRVTATNEGPRYCVSCHLTDNSIANHGTAYAQFRTTLYNNDFANLPWATLQTHIGRNPGNQLDSPYFVHMAAGLGTGLFLFDNRGAAANPLDDNPNRYGSDGVAPADSFDPAQVRYDLDRTVSPTGVSNGSSNQPLYLPVVGPNRRDGATDPNMAGPLGATLSQKLADPTTGIVLDSWVDANRTPRGGATTIIIP